MGGTNCYKWSLHFRVINQRTMASSMITSSAVVTTNRATTTTVAPFTGLRSTSAFPATRKSNDITSITSNGGRVQCMKVWNPYNNQKFETLSYLPPLSTESLAKEVEYLIKNGWVPCLEFDLQGFVYREHGTTPGYYDGRYWTMWKLPMFGCTDASQVLAEVEECKKEYPNAFIRIIGFDNIRQMQNCSFIAYKPEGGCPPAPKANIHLYSYWPYLQRSLGMKI